MLLSCEWTSSRNFRESSAWHHHHMELGLWPELKITLCKLQATRILDRVDLKTNSQQMIQLGALTRSTSCVGSTTLSATAPMAMLGASLIEAVPVPAAVRCEAKTRKLFSQFGHTLWFNFPGWCDSQKLSDNMSQMRSLWPVRSLKNWISLRTRILSPLRFPFGQATFGLPSRPI